MSDAPQLPDLPRQFVIREAGHRIHDPFSPGKLAQLGKALDLRAGMTILDLGSGSGEMLCTWARDHGVRGIGVDVSSAFTAAALARSQELRVRDSVQFVHAKAEDWVDSHVDAGGDLFDVVACLGATWIGGGLFGTVALLEQALLPGGLVLVGEPFWNRMPETGEIARRCHAENIEDFGTLPELVGSFGDNGWDLVQMVIADRHDWDRYVAAQWLSIRRWLDAHADDDPPDVLWESMRNELDSAAADHVRFQREYLGWGVFALMRR